MGNVLGTVFGFTSIGINDLPLGEEKIANGNSLIQESARVISDRKSVG